MNTDRKVWCRHRVRRTEGKVFHGWRREVWDRSFYNTNTQKDPAFGIDLRLPNGREISFCYLSHLGWNTMLLRRLTRS